MRHVTPRWTMVRGAVVVLLMTSQLPWLTDSTKSLIAQTKEDSEKTQGAQLEVTDSDDGQPVAGAEILVTYWIQKKRTVMRRELELRTNAEGIAQLPKIQAERIVITVKAVGYRDCSLWLKAGVRGRNVEIQLEKWRPSN